MLKDYWCDSALRRRLLIWLTLVLVLVVMLVLVRQRPAEEAKLPVLGLSTTLPLQWPEGGLAKALDEDAEPAPAYQRLASQYRIEAVDSFTALPKSRIKLLLLAQSRALAPVELVALDKWVRDGGRLLLLADPALAWESEYQLGDKRRPLFTSLLSPLFAHWGLELAIPIGKDEAEVTRKYGDLTIRTVSPGEWQALGKGDARCTMRSDAMIADCSVGEGRALLIADADLLDARFWGATGVRAVTRSDDFDNMRWLLGELSHLSRD